MALGLGDSAGTGVMTIEDGVGLAQLWSKKSQGVGDWCLGEALGDPPGSGDGLSAEGLLVHTLPPGPLTRGQLWDASESGANPAVTRLTGARLRGLLERAAGAEFQRETPRALRGPFLT